MSTASSRQLERGPSPRSGRSDLSSESARAVGPSLSGSGSSISKTPSGSGAPGLGTSHSPSKARMSSLSSRGGLGTDNATTLSSSGSPPASPLFQTIVRDVSSEHSLAAPLSAGRNAATHSKRVISLDDESKDSSISKDGESEEVSDDEPSTSPSIEDPRVILRTRTSKSGSASHANAPHSSTHANGIVAQTTITTRSLSAGPLTSSSTRPPHVPALLPRGLPSISETGLDPIAAHSLATSSSSISKKKRRKHGSQRSMPSASRSEISSGYASESTLARGGDRSAASTGNLDETGSVSSSHSPTHTRPWPMSNSASTGPISYSSRDRSASRSGESPVDPSMLSARSDSGSKSSGTSSKRDRTKSEARRAAYNASFASADGRLGVTTDDDSSSVDRESPRHGRQPRSARSPEGHELVHVASHLGISGVAGASALLNPNRFASEGTPRAHAAERVPTKKKSKRPSKHEMVALLGVWAYERDGKMQIFGGTTSKLIGKLLDLLVTSPDRDHIYFLVHVFLHGARQFYNAAELLSVLLKYWDLRGDYPEPCGGNIDVVRSSIIFFLAAWFEKRFLVDFGNAADSAKPALEKFMRKLPSQYLQPLQAKLKRMTTQELPIPSVIFIKPLMSSTPSKLSLLDVKPIVLAGQWTLLDMRNFQAIQLSEFYASPTYVDIIQSSGRATLSTSSSSVSGNGSATSGTTPRATSPRPVNLIPTTVEEARPEWTKLLSRGEAFTKWLAFSIVSLTQISQRTKALKRTLDLAIKFLDLNNFHGLMCTWGALNTGAVRRLTKTFRKLPRASIDILRSLDEKLSESNNFANLRWSIHKQRSQGQALIPWFELVAKNRNMLDEYDDVILPADFGSITRENRDSAIYSFSKFAKLSDQIEEFLSCQNNNRHLDLHSTQTHISEQIIQNWLSELGSTGEEELWRLSLLCEPLDSASDSVPN